LFGGQFYFTLRFVKKMIKPWVCEKKKTNEKIIMYKKDEVVHM